MNEYGVVKDSDKDIDSVYVCDKCGKLMTVVESRRTLEHRIPGWIIHAGWAFIMKCLTCEETEE